MTLHLDFPTGPVPSPPSPVIPVPPTSPAKREGPLDGVPLLALGPILALTPLAFRSAVKDLTHLFDRRLLYHQYPSAVTLVKPNPRPIVTPTARAMLDRFDVPEEMDWVGGGGRGWEVVRVDVDGGVKIGGEENGGRVIVGRVGIVDTTVVFGIVMITDVRVNS